MHFWSIKGVYFLQNANNLNFKLFFRLYTWPTKQVFCLYLRKILDNDSFWMSLKSTFLAFNKNGTSCPSLMVKLPEVPFEHYFTAIKHRCIYIWTFTMSFLVCICILPDVWIVLTEYQPSGGFLNICSTNITLLCFAIWPFRISFFVS